MTRVYLGLGTNLGDRFENLRAARAGLPPAVRVLRASPVYETAPWGFTDQPAFLNQVLEVETELSPLDLLGHVKVLESNLGRVPTFRYGPRLIDIDILLYDWQVVETPELSIPHPRLPERAFILAPLADLAPDLVIPGPSPHSIRELLEHVDLTGIERVND